MTRCPGRNPARSLVLALTLALAALAGVAPASRAETGAEVEKLPGYVDGAAFLALATEEGQLVQISLPGTLLKAFCGPLQKEEPDLAAVACGLEWVGAVIVGLDDGARRDRARSLIEETEKRLLGKGWTRLALVREADTLVKVLIRNTEKSIGGLVVLVIDEENVVFTNVAGDVDLAKLGALGERMDIPGLGELSKPEAEEPEEAE